MGRMIIENVDEGLKNTFAGWAKINGKSIRRTLIELMQEYVIKNSGVYVLNHRGDAEKEAIIEE